MAFITIYAIKVHISIPYKIAMKKFLKNQTVVVGLKLYVPPLMYKINTLTISVWEKLRRNPDLRVVITNYVSMSNAPVLCYLLC